MAARFRIDEAHEVPKDLGGHSGHWTVLVGVLLEGTLRLADPLVVPRINGGEWIGQILGFERYGQHLGDTASASETPLGVSIRGVAPPDGTVSLGVAYVANLDEARVIATALTELEPEACKHCNDCLRVTRYVGRPC